MKEKLLEECYVRGIDIITPLVIGIETLEGLVSKGFKSRTLEKIIKETRRILGNIPNKERELEGMREEFFKRNDISEKEIIIDHEGSIEIFSKKDLEELPSVPPPFYITYDERLENIGKSLLLYLGDNFLVIVRNRGLIYEERFRDRREFYISKSPIIRLVWEENNRVFYKYLSIDFLPAHSEGTLSGVDPLGRMYIACLVKWISSRGIDKELGKNPALIAANLLDRDDDTIEHFRKKGYFEEIEKGLEFYWENKDNLAYKIGILLKAYSPTEIAEIYNTISEFHTRDVRVGAEFLKDLAAAFGDSHNKVLIVPKKFLKEYRKLLHEAYEKLKGRKLAIPTYSSWILFRDGSAKRFGREVHPKIRISGRDDGGEFFL